MGRQGIERSLGEEIRDRCMGADRLIPMAPVGSSAARFWSRITGGLFLIMDAWLLLLLAAAGGVGIDASPVVLPWLVGMSALALWLLVAHWLPFVLPIAATVGLGSATFWVIAAFGTTYPFMNAPFVVFSLTAVLTAIQSWQKRPSPLGTSEGDAQDSA